MTKNIPLILKIVAGDKRLVIYRPPLNKVTGSVLGSIFLQQVLWRWDAYGHRPFYRFAAKPDKPNPKYKPGESWQEELGFKRSEYEEARKAVAARVKRGMSKEELSQKWPILYWVDGQKLTWWEVIVPTMTEWLERAYVNVENQHCIDNAGNQHSNTMPKSDNVYTTKTPTQTPPQNSNPLSLIIFQRSWPANWKRIEKSFMGIIPGMQKSPIDTMLIEIEATYSEKPITADELTAAYNHYFTDKPPNFHGPRNPDPMITMIDEYRASQEVKNTVPAPPPPTPEMPEYSNEQRAAMIAKLEAAKKGQTNED